MPRALPLLLLLLPRGGAPQQATTTFVSTLAGFGGFSQTFGDGVGTSVPLYFPRSTCSFDGVNVFFVDRSNHLVRVVNSVTTAVTTVAGSFQATGSADGVGSNAQFSSPIGCCFDITNTTMFVVEFGAHRVRAISLSTRNVTTFAGGGKPGYWDAAVGTAALFNSPWAVTQYKNTLYVADWLNNVIRNISVATGAVGTFLGNNSFPSSGSSPVDGGLKAPRGVAVSPSGMMYIADAGNNRIRRYNMALTSGVSTFVGFNGFSGYADGGSARFNTPAGIAVHPNGLIYVTDLGGCAIRVVTPGGITSTLAGGVCPSTTGESVAAPDGHAWPQTNLGAVSGAVSFLNSGAIAFADSSQHRLRLVTRQTCAAGSFCSGQFGQPWPCPVNFFCPAGSSAPTPCPNGGTTLYASAAASGACITPVSMNATIACNASASVSAGALLPSQLISLPNVTGAAPLVVLSSAAPANAFGYDIVVATAAACAAYANAPGSPACTSQAFPIAGSTYFLLGSAAALGMVAAPACAT